MQSLDNYIDRYGSISREQAYSYFSYFYPNFKKKIIKAIVKEVLKRKSYKLYQGMIYRPNQIVKLGNG